MSAVQPAVACNVDYAILQATLPLFESERVAAIEWSFDALFQRKHIPDWFYQLLQAYAKEGRLLGHGVFFSVFSGKWRPEQTEWLQQLRRLSQTFQFDHITEHFGFLTGADFHAGAPISVPYNDRTLRVGQDRLQRIQDACRCAVGLENLAFSYTLEEVKRHGDFLENLVAPVNGFIILDLHNLYCQSHNFSVPPEVLMACYPLERVREIHISGGSWESVTAAPGRRIRRDTHDERVPGAVYELLQMAIPRCPHLKWVVLEQLGTALRTPEAQWGFQQDFFRMANLIEGFSTETPRTISDFLPAQWPLPSPEPVEDALLYAQQCALSDILETAADTAAAMSALEQSILARSDWQVERWDSGMLETALRIAQKWK